jgi:glycosyltransferase involved in cell wall biosynthesis
MPRFNSPLLTVVLAVKAPTAAQLDGCIAAIAALRNSPRVDLVIVANGCPPAISESCVARLHRLHIVEEHAPRGVYHAYNRGLDQVETPYVMVMGSDDLLLPGLDNVIDSIARGERPHLLASAVLMQDIGVVRPSRWRCGLIFRNWCQQGLLYRSDTLLTRRFDCKYPVQADHKLNMELVSAYGTVIEYRDDVVCHFASGGLSQKVQDFAFRRDMPGMVRAYYGPFFWIVALVKRKLADVLKGRRETQRLKIEIATPPGNRGATAAQLKTEQ